MHHGLLPRGRGALSAGREAAPRRLTAQRPRPRHRHGLPALHAGAEHVGGREPAPVAKSSARCGQVESRAAGHGGVPRDDAVLGGSLGNRRCPLGRREAEARDSEAALSRQSHPHLRRADIGPHARRGRRNPGVAQAHDAGLPAQRLDDYPQAARGQRLRRGGHGAAAREGLRHRARGGAVPHRPHANDGRHDDASRSRRSAHSTPTGLSASSFQSFPPTTTRAIGRSPASHWRFAEARSSESPVYPATVSER